MSQKTSFIKAGFTLIELLVVMMIIAILATISLFSLQSAREAGRDAKRKADLETIRSALEFYRSDCNKYPISEAGGDFYGLWGSVFDNSDQGCSASATNTYLTNVPKDPVSARRYYYSTNASGTNYRICTALESQTTVDAACVGANCGANCSYRVNNP